MLLQLAVGMMLLIACANVAHLLLGQAAGRAGEMATRVALGAGARRLVRQMLAETLVIAVPGGVLGLLLARVGLDAAGRPRAAGAAAASSEIAIDPTVLAFTSGVTLLTAMLFGLGPGVPARAAGASLHGAIGRADDGSRAVRRWHHAIVVTELALAQVLLIGAGLLLASFVAAQRVPLGFEPTGASPRT